MYQIFFFDLDGNTKTFHNAELDVFVVMAYHKHDIIFINSVGELLNIRHLM